MRLRLGLGSWLTRDRLATGAFQSSDRLEQPLAVPQEDAELFEISVGQVRQDFGVNPVLVERRFILAKP